MSNAENRKQTKHPSKIGNNFKWLGGKVLTTLGYGMGLLTALLAVVTIPWITVVAAAISVGVWRAGCHLTNNAEQVHENFKQEKEAANKAVYTAEFNRGLDKKLEGMTPQEKNTVIGLKQAKYSKKWTETHAPQKKTHESWTDQVKANNKDEEVDIGLEATRA